MEEGGWEGPRLGGIALAHQSLSRSTPAAGPPKPAKQLQHGPEQQPAHH